VDHHDLREELAHLLLGRQRISKHNQASSPFQQKDHQEHHHRCWLRRELAKIFRLPAAEAFRMMVVEQFRSALLWTLCDVQQKEASEGWVIHHHHFTETASVLLAVSPLREVPAGDDDDDDSQSKQERLTEEAPSEASWLKSTATSSNESALRTVT
jgi:hypothetical protein